MISRMLAVVSLIVFLLNAGAHVATFIDEFPISVRQTWPIFVAVLVLFFAMLGTLVAGFFREAARMSGMSEEELYEYRDAIEAHPPRFCGSVPLRMVLLIVALFLYAAGTFVANFHDEGVAGIIGELGRYEDKTVDYASTMAADEYARYQSREVRMASAMAALFVFVCFTYFAYRHAAPRPPARFFEARPPDR